MAVVFWISYASLKNKRFKTFAISYKKYIKTMIKLWGAGIL